jgi:flagellar motor switch protein FliM
MAAEKAVLSQREIDALLNADLSEAASEDGPRVLSVKTPSRRIKAYDFRHPEKLSKEQLRSLQSVQQGVATSLAQQLSARLRAPVEAKLSAMERSIYDEYTSQIGHASVLAFIDMSPLQGYAIAAFGLDVGYSIIDRLLGGRGIRGPSSYNRDLSDIETALVRHISSDIANALVEPWSRITELTPEVAEVATGGNAIQVVPPNEFVIIAWYEVRYAGQTGGISLCFPLTILEQIMPSLTGHSMFENRPRGEQAVVERVADSQLLPASVPVRAMLGMGRVPARALADLEVGEVILLDREIDDPTRVFIGNTERFAGSPGLSGRHLAVQLSGLIDEDGFVINFPQRAVAP